VYQKIQYQPDFFTFQLDDAGKIAGISIGEDVFFKKH
jgi:hypothetical protein